MELKFRAWHKERKKYYDVKSIDFEKMYITLIENIKTGTRKVYFNEDLIIEQYTGLKDKNGKEIYVGDILKITLENTRVIYKVLGDYKEFIKDGVYSSYYKLEVVGNIHENKELLK